MNHTLRPAAEMSTAELVNFLKETDAAYRSGASIIDDTTYDEVYRAELISRDPAHPYLHSDKLENRVTPPMKKAAEMSTAELVTFLKETNAAYRSGAPIIDDATYDEVYRAELVSRDPTHSFLNPSQPEAKPSSASTKKEVRHLNPMLSIEKAYTQEDITSFITRVIKYADEQGIKESEIQFRITPKLDGMAANYQDDILATRGDGHTGNDITNNLQRGLITLGGANTGLGEIVISEAYFDENLSDLSSNPSSFVTNLISAANLSKEAIEAMQDKVIRFVPYSLLNHEVCDTVSLRENVEMLCSRIEAECEYPVDGSVIGVLNPEIREAMGSTEYHYNWQIAKKTKDETADLESDSEKLIDLSGGLSINAERPGDNDSLGRERLVDSIAELISHSDQVDPLTIGLLGDWGAGKTTVLNLLERTLDKENKEGINYTVEVFNAWSYEHTESIQAGVAHSAIVGLNRTKKGRLKWFKRVWLSLKLQFKLAPMKATGYSLIVGTWLAGISYLAINGRLQTAWEIGLGATLTLLFLFAALKPFFTHSVTKEFISFFQLPDFTSDSGKLPIYQLQVKELSKLCLTGKERMLFVVDDLDRCSPEGIVKVFEAIRLVMELNNVTVIIAIDHRIALSALAHHYQSLEEQGSVRTKYDVARDYLGKIIQLPINLDRPSVEMVDKYVASLFEGNIAVQEDNQKNEVIDTNSNHFIENVAAVEGDRNSLNTDNTNRVKIDLPALFEALKNKTMLHSQAEKQRFIDLTHIFHFHNPRQLKRLHSSYRLLRAYTKAEEKENLKHLCGLFILEYQCDHTEGDNQIVESEFLDFLKTRKGHKSKVFTYLGESFASDQEYLAVKKIVEPFVLPQIAINNITCKVQDEKSGMASG